MMNGQLSVPVDLAVLTMAEELTDRQLIEQLVQGRSETAFAALVRRHGPLVLGVCRRLLGHAHDAEDAFQATFLVLLRKAASLKQPDLLASWLYGVAYRTARHARGQALQRGKREREAAMSEARNDPQHLLAQELKQLLDHELAQLPEQYRAPLILCYLEGKTNAEAAQMLGWPTGSISYRLARGREMLRERLTRRQGALCPTLTAAFLSDPLEMVSVHPVLVHATVQAALVLLAPREIVSGLISASVKQLMEATLWSLDASRRRWLFAILLAVLVFSGLASVVSAAMQQASPSAPTATAGSCNH
jgi:RNA polymerase sigma factor (sigma-70 family)